MSDPSAPRDGVPTGDIAGPSPGGARGAASRHVCRRLAAGPGTGLTDEMSYLLRTRLRLAILIVLVGLTFHFLRNTLLGPASDRGTPWLVFRACEVAVLATASALLWGRRSLSMKGLRVLELTIFGTIAAFFAWLQFNAYRDGALLHALVPGHEATLFRLVGRYAAFPWFLLIVLYGAFIPNTWRRCAAVVGFLAFIPLVLMFIACHDCTVMGRHMGDVLFGTTTVLGMASAIAIFGSYK